MKLMIINGSVREGRKSDTVQNWALPILQNDPSLELDIVDLKEVDLPFFNEAITPDAAKGQFINPKGTAWAKRVSDADAFIFITAEYNHGPTAVLKNALDWVYDGWANKPVGFISYGGLAGGTRAVQQLKQNVLDVKLYPALANVHIPGIWSAFDENGKPNQPDLDERLTKLVAELKDLQNRLKSS